MIDPSNPRPDSAAQLDVAKIYRQSWQVFSKHWAFILVVGFGTSILTFVLTEAAKWLTKDASAGALISILINLVISNVIALGWIKNYLAMGRGSQPDLQEFTKSANKLPIYLAGIILLALMIVAGLLCFVLPGVYLAIRYQFLPTLLTDKNISIRQGFALAGKLTQGQMANLMVLMLCNLGLLFVGFLTLGIGLIVAVPITTIAGTIAYLELESRLPQLAE